MQSSGWRTPTVVLVSGALMLSLAVGMRHGFGLWLQPMTLEHGWGREVFGFAIALQNLIWGATQPFTGMATDRWGAGKVGAVGAVVYAIGLALMASSHTGFMLALSAGVLVGIGLSCTTFATVFAAVGRAMPVTQRSMALGVAGAVGSFGQFCFLPIEQWLISGIGWSDALLVLAALTLLILPLCAALWKDGSTVAPAASDLSAGAALREAFRHRGYLLLSAGYWVCGFHITFMGTHLPAYLVDRGLSTTVGTTTLALIGLFNIAGSYLAGSLGARMPKPVILTGIYLLRAVAITAFAFVVPLSQWSAYAFAIVLGFTWLSTVPLTTGTIASVFGVRNMSMLGGITFFSHQIGAFFGGWLGGRMYDATGSYDVVWMIAIALGVAAAALTWPVRERPVARLAQAGA